MKAVVKSFEGSSILVTQAKDSLQPTDVATQLLKIKDKYRCLVKQIETMEITKYSIKEVVIHELDLREDTCSIKH